MGKMCTDLLEELADGGNGTEAHQRGIDAHRDRLAHLRNHVQTLHAMVRVGTRKLGLELDRG